MVPFAEGESLRSGNDENARKKNTGSTKYCHPASLSVPCLNQPFVGLRVLYQFVSLGYMPASDVGWYRESLCINYA
tara:strand:- start:532 stop:759 length:228 start_codon:yes stop_codon:yes gene_type:complete